MPRKKRNTGDRAETGENDPLLHSYRRVHYKHLGRSEPATGPRAGDQVVNTTDDHNSQGLEHGENHHHDDDNNNNNMNADRPMVATITIATCHCGAGCVLGDLVGERLIYRLDATIGGSMLYAAFIVGKSALVESP